VVQQYHYNQHSQCVTIASGQLADLALFYIVTVSPVGFLTILPLITVTFIHSFIDTVVEEGGIKGGHTCATIREG
jgi:hypothetical protein